MDDSRIVELFLSRDESAVSHAAGKYGTKLRTIANRILDDPAAAEECENDTYLAAWNLIPPNEPRTYLFSFLSRITRHIALDMIRKRNSDKRSAVFCELTDEMAECLPADTPGVEDEVVAEELSALISAFLKTRSEEQRTVFVRRYWHFDTIEGIGKLTGFSKSKVKMMLSRRRRDLREVLRKEGYTV